MVAFYVFSPLCLGWRFASLLSFELFGITVVFIFDGFNVFQFANIVLLRLCWLWLSWLDVLIMFVS